MKRKNFKILLSVFSALALLIFAAGCTNENEDFSGGKAQIQFELTDAPSLDLAKVVIDIQGVKVGVADEFYEGDDDPFYDENDDVDEVEWVTLNISKPGLYNLLDYRNGEMIALAGGEIPAGKISQVRLLLGSGSYVETMDGKEYPLKTPSAQTSGLKFSLHETLLADKMYKFVIDFDAARSVVATGNNKYILHPVIRTYAKDWGATLRGFVLPPEANAFVQITKATDTLISLPEEDGKFLFPGIDEGTWKVEFIADTATEYTNFVMESVPVVKGEIKDVGTVTLVK